MPPLTSIILEKNPFILVEHHADGVEFFVFPNALDRKKHTAELIAKETPMDAVQYMDMLENGGLLINYHTQPPCVVMQWLTLRGHTSDEG